MPNHQRVYIGGIPTDARDRDLEKFFKGYGRINEVVIKNGYGFVEFDAYDSVDIVVQQREHYIQGHRIRVDLALPIVNDLLYSDDCAAAQVTFMPACLK